MSTTPISDVAWKKHDMWGQPASIRETTMRDCARELERDLTAASDEITKLKEELAFRIGQAREAISERDSYRMRAEQKRMVAREFESLLGFSEEEARQEGAIEEAVKRIKSMKENQCEKEPVAWVDDMLLVDPTLDRNIESYLRDLMCVPLYRKAKP